MYSSPLSNRKQLMCCFGNLILHQLSNSKQTRFRSLFFFRRKMYLNRELSSMNVQKYLSSSGLLIEILPLICEWISSSANMVFVMLVRNGITCILAVMQLAHCRSLDGMPSMPIFSFILISALKCGWMNFLCQSMYFWSWDCSFHILSVQVKIAHFLSFLYFVSIFTLFIFTLSN